MEEQKNRIEIIGKAFEQEFGRFADLNLDDTDLSGAEDFAA